MAWYKSLININFAMKPYLGLQFYTDLFLLLIMKYLSIVILLFFVKSIYVISGETIVISTYEAPPYTSHNLKHYGILPHIISDVFTAADINVEYLFESSPARAIKSAKSGNVDGTFLWTKTPERIKFLLFSKKPIACGAFVFFHLKNTPFSWKSYEDLSSYRIGATIGYFYTDQFAEGEKKGKLQVSRVKSDLQNINMLLKGRIDIFPLEKFMGYAKINNLFPYPKNELFTHHDKPLKKEPAFFILSKKNPKAQSLMDKYEQGFDRIIISGKHNNYINDLKSCFKNQN